MGIARKTPGKKKKNVVVICVIPSVLDPVSAGWKKEKKRRKQEKDQIDGLPLYERSSPAAAPVLTCCTVRLDKPSGVPHTDTIRASHSRKVDQLATPSVESLPQRDNEVPDFLPNRSRSPPPCIRPTATSRTVPHVGRHHFQPAGQILNRFPSSRPIFASTPAATPRPSIVSSASTSACPFLFSTGSSSQFLHQLLPAGQQQRQHVLEERIRRQERGRLQHP